MRMGSFGGGFNRRSSPVHPFSRTHHCSILKPRKVIRFMLTINLLLVLISEVCIYSANAANGGGRSSSAEEDEFAEFIDEDENPIPGQGSVNVQQPKPSEPEVKKPVPVEPQKPSREFSQETTIEDEESESFVEDEEEEDIFEHIAEPKQEQEKPTKKSGDLKFTKVPIHLVASWKAFYLEIILALGILIYFINFLTGRSTNAKVANAWFESHRELLESNFALVGDDGKKEIQEHGVLKETESVFFLWCSGRVSCDSMFVELRLWKRHDLVSLISKVFKPVNDQIIVTVNLNQDSMDSFVFCVATKKTAQRLVKEETDLNTFCAERKPADKFGINSDKFVLMNEIGEVAAAILDTRVVSVINKFEACIDYIHISDQYSGPKNPDSETSGCQEGHGFLIQPRSSENFTKLPVDETEDDEDGMNDRRELGWIDEQRPLMQVVFYLMDKIKKVRLSKEGKTKAEKNRQKVEEAFLKATHVQRQEAAQVKREERKRAEKERMLAEEDPDKQRKWEEREYRKEMKRKTPKMKQLKVKAM